MSYTQRRVTMTRWRKATMSDGPLAECQTAFPARVRATCLSVIGDTRFKSNCVILLHNVRLHAHEGEQTADMFAQRPLLGFKFGREIFASSACALRMADTRYGLHRPAGLSTRGGISRSYARSGRNMSRTGIGATRSRQLG